MPTRILRRLGVGVLAAASAAVAPALTAPASAAPASVGTAAHSVQDVRVTPSVGSAPYALILNANDLDGTNNDRLCVNLYHQYGATPGCGGVDVSFTIPDAQDIATSRAGVRAAVTTRYGCVRPGSRTARVVLTRTRTVDFANVYVPELGYWTAADGTARAELFYAAPPETVTCWRREKPVHLSTKVANLVLQIVPPGYPAPPPSESFPQTGLSWRAAAALPLPRA